MKQLQSWRRKHMEIRLSNAEQEEYYELIINKKNIISQKKAGTWKKKNPLTYINSKCKFYLKKNLKELMFLSADELDRLIKSIPLDELVQLKDLLLKTPYKKRKKGGAVERIQGNYLADELYANMKKSARKIIFEKAGFKTCPYCNRNYVNMVKRNKSDYSSTFELDHFYNKAKYPFFAVSVNNLIPTCPSCNRIKNEKAFILNPYKSLNYNSYHFKLDIKKVLPVCEDDIDLNLTYSDYNVGLQMQMLYLEELYNNHKDVALDIINKTKKYNESYGKSVMNSLKGLFKDWDELYRMIYGVYLDEEQWNNRPLSKFTHDIYEETKAAISDGRL